MSQTNMTLTGLDETRRQWELAGRSVSEAMEFAYTVVRAQQYLVSYFEELLAGIDLTWSRFECLVVLFYSPNDQLGLKTVSERLGVHQTTITYAVDQLEKQGLIERLGHPDDRRRKLATLTEDGRAKVEQAFDLLEAAEFCSGGVAKADQTRVSKTLRRLIASEPPALSPSEFRRPTPTDAPRAAPGRPSRGGAARR